MPTNEEAIMNLVREEFRKKYGSDSTSVLLDRATLTSFDNDTSTVTLEIASQFTYRILKERYQKVLDDTFSSLLGFSVTVNLVDTGAPADVEKLKRQLTRDAFGHTADESSAPEKKPEPAPQKTFDPQNSADGPVGLPDFTFEYTFDNFIVGSSNKFAHAACIAVVDKPARDYNPLFLYGPSGIGKTHLLYAIMNALRQKYAGIRINYVKGEDFTNEMIDCISRQNMKEFRDKYRSCDVLLIDDIQFIAGKVATQEEFFHTFNALYEAKKQIILASDKPPREIQTLEKRLESRFEWGLLADIQPPDLELRMAIIKKKAEQVNIPINDEILVYLAENLRSNIRQLEGAIKKLAAFYFLGREITMDMARGCISELLGGAEPLGVTVNKIFAAVTRKYHVTKEDMIGKKRSKEIAFARHVAIYLIHDVTEMSQNSIGKMFERDHTTVINSLDNIDRKLRTDKAFAADYEAMKKEVVGA